MIFFLFWLLIFIVFYTFIGYGILLFLLVKIKRLWRPARPLSTDIDWPAVTVVVAAYNEVGYVAQKLQNCVELDYPADRIHFYIVTDGSDDGTPEVVQNYAQQDTRVTCWHQAAREGKIAAVARTMPFVKTPIVVFTDANTDLNSEAIKNLVKHYQNPVIGAVAGEKRVKIDTNAAAAGEGAYWKYESQLKKWDAELYSVVGAAGELFSMRTHLFKPVPKDTLIEDFVLTLQIARQGYRTAYAPDAYAIETASANVTEELKRKIRIAAGGLQAVWRLRDLLNPLAYNILSFQYVSHRVLRWTASPLALPLIFGLNAVLILRGEGWLYAAIGSAQCLFYMAAGMGWWLDKRGHKVKFLYLPYYFCMMHYAVFAGFKRLLTRQQTVVWEKSRRQ